MKLLTPMQIGSLTLKNRMIMAPMATHFATENSEATETMKNYYAERARGGVAMITLESCFVHLSGRGGARRLGIYKDSLVPGLKSVTDAVHENGALVCCELHHGGPQCKSDLIGEMPLCASSSNYQKGMETIPRMLTREEIPQMVDYFARGAERARDAGFDAIMLHFGHGYLANSFLSPLSNTREDEYGGSLENRARFPLEIVAGIRTALGRDFPLIVRLSAEDGIVAGMSLDESLQLAKMLEEAMVDCLQITAGIHLVMYRMVQPMAMPRGCLVPFVRRFKEAVSIPVAVVGRINNPALAEEILQNGDADAIYLGRPLIADPYYPQKVMDGRPQDIRPCIACNQGCGAHMRTEEAITCFGNPRCGSGGGAPCDAGGESEKRRGHRRRPGRYGGRQGGCPARTQGEPV